MQLIYGIPAILLTGTQDIHLAKTLFAHKNPSTNVFETHGVDLILGGHDHLYYVGNGIDSWEGHPIGEEVLGVTGDDGVRSLFYYPQKIG